MPHTSTQSREGAQDRPNNNCVEQVCLIIVTSRNKGEGLFIEAEMTHTATSPKPAPAWVTVHKTGKSEYHCIAYMNLNRLGVS